MILGTLTLTDFSVYAGTQSIDLAPAHSERPIILIGGLNGAGKTSLLTAVKLALYGKRIAQLDQTPKSYTAFMRGLIHEGASSAAVDLEFHTYSLGDRITYRIRRTWSVGEDGRISEVTTAWKDGVDDHVLSSTWDDFIDAIMPASIAHLFFFDGEKVAEMANAEGARALLQTGVQSLLGIDLLARLQDDLAALMHKKAKANNDNGDTQELERLEQDIAGFEEQWGGLRVALSTKEEELQAQAERLAEIETRFNEAGAHLFLERKGIEEELKTAKAVLAEVNAELVELAAGPLPLALVADLLAQVREQDRREQEASTAAAVLGVIEERDQRTLELLANEDANLREKIESFLIGDREKRAQAAQVEPYLNLSAEGRAQFAGLDAVLKEERAKAKRLLRIQGEAEQRLQDAERRLGMVPPASSVAGIIEERKKELAAAEGVGKELEAIRKKLAQCEGMITFRSAEKERVLRRMSASQAGESVEARVAHYAQRARERAGQFAQRVLLRSVEELQELILDSMQQLFRKEGFVCRVRIGPGDFSLTLFHKGNAVLPLQQLSAGERQLVIIAILWGLGRASGRPLPLIIDTPLGRLDSHHRNNLLESYLPGASHQTILLATDTEVTEQDTRQLKPFMGRSYLLRYDNRARKTVIDSDTLWSHA